jgi:hypothetical protein
MSKVIETATVCQETFGSDFRGAPDATTRDFLRSRARCGQIGHKPEAPAKVIPSLALQTCVPSVQPNRVAPLAKAAGRREYP